MKRLACFLLVLFLLLSSYGCALEEVSLRYEAPFLGFSQAVGEEFSLEDYTQTPEAQIENHDPQWGKYGADVYYSRLDEIAQGIYRVLQYAMDQEQPYILIDDRLLEGTSFSLGEILNAVALDSPMVEQNLEWGHATFSSTVTHNRLFAPPVTETLTGQSLFISDFTPEKLEKKRKALEKAEQIVSTLPEGSSPRQTAEAIYCYLGEHVQYFNTEVNREAVDYLYDALCIGRSNCDGFANAYSLLCSLSGIRCCEKMSEPPAQTEAGHTWNAVELDGVWYNVDATAAEEVTQEENLRLHFGFADNRQDAGLWRSDLCPPCDRELYPFDCSLTGEKGAGKTLRKELKKVNRDYLIVSVESGELSKDALQEIANTTNHDITTYRADTLDGGAVYYIYFD